MALQLEHDEHQTAGGGDHRATPPPPPNMLTFSSSSSSSVSFTSAATITPTATTNPSGAVVHPSTSSPPPSSTTARLRPTANSYPLVLKFEEVVCKVKLRQPAGGWCEMLSAAASVTVGGGDGRKKKLPAAGSAREKTIISGMSGVVRPGEMLAMLGPSGSGKTTLLTALGGRHGSRALLSGKITYNGQPFSGAVKRRTGFVTQHDVLYPHLTVAETLWYTALLRLPRSLGAGEKRAQVEAVVRELGLTKVAHSMVGGVRGVRGLSGGERKRVSIGLEMLVDPSLLLLDEPTSGLDSTTAARIVGTLRRMAAEGGRTVVVTIHQPSSRLYHMFDKVLLLSADGCPVYYGRAADALSYFASVGFASPLSLNPADLMLDLANGIALQTTNGDGEGGEARMAAVTGGSESEHKEVRAKLAGAYERQIAPAVKLDVCARETAVSASSGGGQVASRRGSSSAEWTTGWWRQFLVLLQRGLKERRHESFNKLRIFQVLSVATLAGLLWWRTPAAHLQDRTALIFFFSVFWGFFPLYNAVFTFPLERPMLLKERSSGMYRLSSYFAARSATDLPMELGLPTAFVLILYWMGGLEPSPGPFLLSLAVVLYSVLVAQSLGLAIGAVLMDVKQGTTLASVITMIFLIAGGYYVQHIPPFVAWLRWLNYSFYCYRLLLGIQFPGGGGYYECDGAGGRHALCPVAEFPAIKAVGLDNHWVDVCVMALLLVGYRVIAYIALDRLKPR
ncbi:ABC transporter G family member 14-like [Phragmites australis]|uniref:ABC transporter G family member 14-like n=1 Tax=Phragmites australis TaxID=29695 RepID=UPI002D772CA8|nr:ABC transporter G family member 14-like [Phragmites australis]